MLLNIYDKHTPALIACENDFVVLVYDRQNNDDNLTCCSAAFLPEDLEIVASSWFRTFYRIGLAGWRPRT